jgi:hypothetical protein
MKVRDLIELLEDADPELLVVIEYDSSLYKVKGIKPFVKTVKYKNTSYSVPEGLNVVQIEYDEYR